MSDSTSPDRIPVWLDVDTGHDDAYALLLAVYWPQVDLLGVSTVHGNASLKHTTFNTRSVLEAIGRNDINVYPGASKPIERDAVHAEAIHGESGLDGVTLLPEPVKPPIENEDAHAVAYKALIQTKPQTAWVVATGTLTNAGLLFQKYPDLAGHVKGVSIMGGAIGGNFTDAPMGKVEGDGERFGNWTRYAEFNIYCDPEAARSILENPILAPKTTLIPLDLTHQVLATQDIRKRLLYGDSTNDSHQKPSPLRALFFEIISFFAHTYAEVFALTAGPPLHDPLAVAAVFAPELFTDSDGERFNVHVECDGAHSYDPEKQGEVGRTVIKPVAKGQQGVRIPRGVDVQRFWDMIETVLQKAEEASPMPALTETQRSVFQKRLEVGNI